MSKTIARSYIQFGDETLMKMTDLSRSEMKIFLKLASMCGYSGAARITQLELAEALGMNLRTISKAYEKLRKAGFLAVAGHGKVVFNPVLLMRGKDEQFQAKYAIYRAAMRGKPEPAEEVVRTNAEFVAKMIGGVAFEDDGPPDNAAPMEAYEDGE